MQSAIPLALALGRPLEVLVAASQDLHVPAGKALLQDLTAQAFDALARQHRETPCQPEPLSLQEHGSAMSLRQAAS